ncbi:alpha/beta hydrolase [Pseudomonas thivervalensis]|uniref:alpha/beta hydrolase n=1 Tax=Pseudomonas thivervalensis TaxID=86265 RepID=UPI003D98AC62
MANFMALKVGYVLLLVSGLLSGCMSTPEPAVVVTDEPVVEEVVIIEIEDPALVPIPLPAEAVQVAPPVPSGHNNVIVRTYYGTNRLATGSKEPYLAYGTHEGPLSYGVADVSIPRDHRLGALESPNSGMRTLENKNKHIMLMGLQPVEREILLTLIAQDVENSDGKSALVFIHGYTVSFEDAARRTAQLSYDLGFKGVPIFYSWPSREDVWKYEQDGDVIKRATPKFTAFLEDIFKRTGVENVYLVAHSMGNRAMIESMSTLIQDDQIRPKVRQLILTAPDVPASEFEKDYAPALVNAGAPVTLYASSKDWAMKASKKMNEGYRRLGDTKGEVSVIKGIETIDASAVKTDFLGHSYFAENGSVVSDIFYLFRTNLRPDARFNMKGIEVKQGRYWAFRSNLCTP